MSEPTLLPCPFCGSALAMMRPPTARPETPYNPADRLYPVVSCYECFASASGRDEDYKGTTAIAAWNRRAPTQQPTPEKP